MTQLRDLLAKATPRPWTVWLREDYDPARFLTYRQRTVIGDGDLGRWSPVGFNENDRDDAALIVAAINALPQLLDVADAAQALALSVRGLQNANWDDAGTTRVHRDLVLDKDFALRTALAALKEAK